MVKVSDANFEFQKVIAILGVSLMAVKFFAYYLTGSVAILTDALESIVNVIAAFVGLFALYISAQPADRSHPFGHGKAELISASIEATMIMVAGALIMVESIQSFLHPGEISDLDVGLVLVALAAVANLVVGRIAIRKGMRTRSPALVASGKHLCSDTVSSIGILIGLVVVYVAMAMGYDARWLDSSIAIVFGVIILITGLKVMRECMDDIMDKADREILETVTESINEYRHDDWIDVFRLRMIKYGPKIYVDMHMVFPRNMTVRDIADETDEMEEAIRARYDDSVEITITPVPCSEYNCRNCNRNCFDRRCGFERRIVWTPDMLCCSEPHAVDPRITILEDSENIIF